MLYVFFIRSNHQLDIFGTRFLVLRNLVYSYDKGAGILKKEGAALIPEG
jgi:hypothetical protein